MIVVTAPTGNIGHRVVARLIDSGIAVRLVARDPGRIPAEVAARVEIVAGSHGNAGVIDRALDGASALFWLAPADSTLTPDQAYVDFTRPAAEAIRRHRVGRVVSITALGRGTAWQDKAGLVTASLRMDDLLMSTGVAFRGLAMPSFMDNILMHAASIRDVGMVFGAVDPDRKVPVTAVRDMASAAAGFLADNGWTGQAEVPLLGPEDLSMNDMADIIGEVLGRGIRYQQIAFEAFRERLLSRGTSPSFAQGYIDMFRAKDEGIDNVARRSGAGLTPTSFRTWCETELKPAIAW